MYKALNMNMYLRLDQYLRAIGDGVSWPESVARVAETLW